MTTGPLGAGVSHAVGMALAEAHLAEVFNMDKYDVIDHYTYALVGDGCLMEGVSAEALSFAGTQKLNKLIVLYDSNNITIEGDTDLAFREDVSMRMKSYGFHTILVEDGNDLVQIGRAIEQAKAQTNAPTFIEIKTEIGFGSPLVGTSAAHSDPMGEANVLQTRKNLNWDNENPFEIEKEVYDHYESLARVGEQKEVQWNNLLTRYRNQYPQLAKLWDVYFNHSLPIDLLNDEEYWKFENKPAATRNISGTILNYLADKVPNLIGGSADLGPSNKTVLNGYDAFDVDARDGRNIHFGVRENGMAAIVNGMALHGGLRPYGATFFVFTDYMKPMLRLASLMEINPTYVMTHDSIGVGEDGPTHEPIEQLTMLRAQPNMIVYRPADATETAAGWLVALESERTPVTLVLSRQNLPQLENSSKEALKGGYVISEAKENADGILLASGSEVSLAIDAQEELAKEGIFVNVVSMPSQELFDKQSQEYRESVLPSHLTKRLAIEAGATLPWYKYVGLKGNVLGIDTFGSSAPGEILFEKFGFTTDNVVNLFKQLD